ncbi:epsilon DNA polymerase [Coprinopsis cinerea okayama7|uniref:DNA polymerase epsilon subunit n=1 Tax=Coprinopsis cinerea (strain Okayama-7 / 130 / ATCC MYA-4618 / FGSC 9003) TaxID=240176 RepID=A8NXS5_COPC7|nr:epsilon DNA polymerase [Coprinopsis cinerea okayama7\|eukprot:XP_001837253.2 epsilon DNA polymerase [Coprinopsis cinerea okayama7\
MSDRQRIIIKVFRKFSNSLGPEVIQFLESIIEQHDIPDEDVETSIDLIAKEYNKEDDATMKVSLDVLQRVYESLQDRGEDNQVEHEFIDPDNHLFVIDAYDMPRWVWSQERVHFHVDSQWILLLRISTSLSSAGTPESRIASMRDRLHIIKQCVLRNEHFAPSTLPAHDRERLVTLRSTKQLLGRAGERFLLLGLLAHNKEGKVCLEDSDGRVELDFSRLDEPGDGFFTDGCFALVEGEYTEEGTLEIIAIGQPPCEPRETSRSIYGHIDFLGKGATSLLEDRQYALRVKQELADLHFFFFSDVWLDHPQTLPGLQKIFDNCIENDFVPKLIVMCGNFTSKTIAHGNARDIQRYQDNFDALGDLISSYHNIAHSTHIVFVPGPLDITVNSVLPKRPILAAFVNRLKSKFPKAHFATNPCRIKFFNQELVIFREDLMAKMLRNIIGVKADVKSEDLKRFTILDQTHLSPLSLHIQPTLSDYDHAMRLYPLPTVLVLADKYDRFKMTYTGCHVFNPGSFVGKTLSWSAYKPSEINSEECTLELESDDS